MPQTVRVPVDPGFTLQCDVDDFLWPWEKSEPVLMLHGFARHARFWDRWVPTLAAKHRVYRPELRGFGRSDTPPDDYEFTIDAIRSDIIKVMDACGLEHAHFVGESSGGIFNVLFALAHPERVTSLVLCDTPIKGSTSTTPKLREIFSLGEESAGAAMIKHGVGAWCRETLSYRLDTERASPELQKWYIDEMDTSRRYPSAAINDMIRTTPSVAPLIKDLKMPVLLLGGANSKLSGNQQEEVVKQFPNGKLKLFEGYGHAVNVLVPEECAKTAVDFWAEL